MKKKRIVCLLTALLVLLAACFPASSIESNSSAEELNKTLRTLMAENLDPQTQLSVDDERLAVSASELAEIRAAALVAASSHSSDYQKIKAVAAYVADSVYYDRDTFYKIDGADRSQDPYSVFSSHLAICYGYAYLTALMLRSIGIPCAIVDGEVISSGGEHHWNAAWDGEKWVFVDSTWMSRNTCYNSTELSYGGVNNSWFDISPETESAQRYFEYPGGAVTLDGVQYEILTDWKNFTITYKLPAGMDNFSEKRSYGRGFSDVSRESWYYDGVELTYTLGIIDGMGDGSFKPEESVTVAQALKMAAVAHSVYNGLEGKFNQSGAWYSVYVEYALENGMIEVGDFSNYEKPATRAEFAYICAGALPENELPQSGGKVVIPDVAANAPYADEIILLYSAGILNGVDDSGSFAPDEGLTRAQAATMIARLASPSLRVAR